MLPIAFQLWSIQDEIDKDFKGTLCRLKEYGYDGIELAGLNGFSPSEVKELTQNIGLIPISAHVDYEEIIKDPDGTMRIYKKIGCSYIVIPWMDEEYRFGSGKEKEFLEGIRSLAGTVKKHDLTMLYHNHDFEFEKIENEYILDILFNTIPEEILKSEIDTCWASFVGVDPAAYIRKYTGRAPIIHIKDYVMAKGAQRGAYSLDDVIDSDDRARSGGFEFRPVGYGELDIPAIAAAANDACTEWIVVEQDETCMGKTMMECAEMSINYLKSL